MGGILLRGVSLGYGAARRLRKLCLGLGIAAALSLGAVGAAPAEPVVIAAMGDSLTQGYGLAPEDGFVAQLQRWLDAHGAEVRLINAGVSGDTTRGGLARVGWTLTPEVQAMILALGANDMLRGLPPEQAEANLAAILEAAQAAGVPVLLVGVKAAGNYGPDYKRDFDAIYPALAERFGVPLVEDFVGPVRKALAEGQPMQTLLQSDRLHPSAAGVALIVEAIGPRVQELAETVRAGAGQ